MKRLLVWSSILHLLSNFIYGERCSDCIHLDYTVTGLRPSSKILLDSMLHDTFNPDCLVDNRDVNATCTSDGQSMEGKVFKCKKTHIIVEATGMKGVEPNAKVNMIAIEKRCVAVNASTENRCISHFEDNSVSVYISKTLLHLTDVWNSVNYTGTNCFSDTQGDVANQTVTRNSMYSLPSTKTTTDKQKTTRKQERSDKYITESGIQRQEKTTQFLKYDRYSNNGNKGSLDVPFVLFFLFAWLFEETQ